MQLQFKNPVKKPHPAPDRFHSYKIYFIIFVLRIFLIYIFGGGMNSSLLEVFSKLPDARRGEGKRHSIEFCYLLFVMSILSGYNGIKPFGQFVRNNYEELVEHFKPVKGRLPSYSTMRRILLNTDFVALQESFNTWAAEYCDLILNGEYSIDGKSIASTVTNSHNSLQNFVSIVTIFSQNTKNVIKQSSHENKKENELSVVLQMLSQYNLEGKIFTLDALHSQKN